MRTITKTIQVYSFDELNEQAQEKAIIDHINFEIEVMDENSPFYSAALEMERMQTPWFLAETLFFDYKEQIIETIKANEYEFTQDGKIYSE